MDCHRNTNLHGHAHRHGAVHPGGHVRSGPIHRQETGRRNIRGIQNWDNSLDFGLQIAPHIKRPRKHAQIHIDVVLSIVEIRYTTRIHEPPVVVSTLMRRTLQDGGYVSFTNSNGDAPMLPGGARRLRLRLHWRDGAYVIQVMTHTF